MKERQQYTRRSPFKAIEIEADICNGCNRCADTCPMDVLAPNPVHGAPPLVVYPEECWFCGCCVDRCPLQDKGAIRVIIPLPMRVAVFPKSLATGENGSEGRQPAIG